MRVIVMVKASKQSEEGIMPPKEQFLEMDAFSQELRKAGIVEVYATGLQVSRKGKRIRFANGGTDVIDGPFAESKEVVAGFSIWDVASMDEAVKWARRCPCALPGGEAEIEIRAFMSAEDFPAGMFTDAEIRAHEEEQRTRGAQLGAGR